MYNLCYIKIIFWSYSLYVDTAGIQYGQDGWLNMSRRQLTCEQGNLGTVGTSCLSTGTQQQLMRSEYTNIWIEKEGKKH